MDVNALNYCRFSLLPTKGKEREEAWIALPNLTDSETVSVARLLYGSLGCCTHSPSHYHCRSTFSTSHPSHDLMLPLATCPPYHQARTSPKALSTPISLVSHQRFLSFALTADSQ